jgi:hypothetical protein
MVVRRVAEKETEPPQGATFLTRCRAQRAAGSGATWQVLAGAKPA